MNAPHEAGRELDALIAEKVMGIVWDESRCRVCGWPLAKSMAEFERSGGCLPTSCALRPPPEYHADEPAPYSTAIESAWLVVEKMRERDFSVDIQISSGPMNAYRVEFWPNEIEDEDSASYAESAPLAICRAALAAVEAPR